MSIGNAVQRGSNVFIYNEKGQQTGTVLVNVGSEDGLKGYTSSNVNIRRGSYIISYDETGRQISSVLV
jgi:hypothetical protein